jgi:hypothetical protein
MRVYGSDIEESREIPGPKADSLGREATCGLPVQRPGKGERGGKP